MTAILAGFFTAVIFANINGPLADMIEKWASWGLGLFILFLGSRRYPNR
jgi:sodium/proline symporter